MEKDKLEKFTSEQLRKRRKFGSILLVILIAAFIVDGVATIYVLVIGEGLDISLFVPAIACFVIAIPMYLEPAYKLGV